MNEDILIISHHLIPYTPSYGQIARQLTLANHLSKNNRIHIVTVRGNKYFGDYGYKYGKNIITHYVQDPNYIFDQKSLQLQGNNKLSKFVHIINRYGVQKGIGIIINKLKNIVTLDKYEYPAVNTFYRKSVEIIKKEKISKILVMTPVYSFHKLVFILKRHFPKIPLVLDIQDSWVIPALLDSKSIKAFRSRAYEKKSISSADYVVFNVPVMQKHYVDYYQIQNKTKLFMNGFDSKHSSEKTPDGESPIFLSESKINIGYFGKIHIGNNDYFRDIRKFFDFIKNSDNYFKNLLQLDIFGYFSGNYSDWKDHVPFDYKGMLEFKKVPDFMEYYDYLLLFHSDEARAEEVLTGKIFEYLKSRKPVIVLGPANMIEARNLIVNNRLGIFININDPKDMKKKLLFLHALKVSGEIDRYFNKSFDVDQFDRNKINDSYSKFIDSI